MTRSVAALSRPDASVLCSGCLAVVIPAFRFRFEPISPRRRCFKLTPPFVDVRLSEPVTAEETLKVFTWSLYCFIHVEFFDLQYFNNQLFKSVKSGDVGSPKKSGLGLGQFRKTRSNPKIPSQAYKFQV